MASKKYDDLSKEELVRLLESRDRRDATRFGLVWEASEIERDKALNQDFVALDLDPSLSCGPKGGPWKNLIIEGDNFDALRYLRMTFAGRVKCIYIDPPYNTGNKDFVYNDHFVDKEDLWRHSKWCEFMFQRLTLAKELLREDGAIFVSIDDNEVFTLGLLMQRIYGTNNFIANIVWEKSYTANQTAKFISDNHDYIIAFSRNTAAFRMGKLSRTEEQIAKFKNPDSDPRGPWKAENLSAGKFYSTGYFEITGPSGRKFLPPKGRYWRCNEPQYQEWLADNRITFGLGGEGRPMLKKYLAEMNDGLTPRTWWTHQEVGSNKQASIDLKSILTGDTEFFSAPKPVTLIERILTLSGGTNDLVLDFFAGSGTTAHAVHKLNKEDGGNRRVILVSSTEATAEEPQKNLCRDVCATRVRRVIEGYGDTPGLGGDFAYLRCRRIAPGRLTQIDHPQVWTALQLTHCPALLPYEDKPVLHADNEEQRLVYLPHYRAKDARCLLKIVRGSPAVIVYTWQPELLKQRLRLEQHVQVEAVPEALARRFGIRS
jgi:adenine-specific DNA-methyltransferase